MFPKNKRPQISDAGHGLIDMSHFIAEAMARLGHVILLKRF